MTSAPYGFFIKRTPRRQVPAGIEMAIVRVKSSIVGGAGRIGTVALLLALCVLIAVTASQLVGSSEFGESKEELAITVDHAIGATVERLDPATAGTLGLNPRSRGLVVTSVSQTGPAARAGIRAGDVIERIGNMPVKSLEDAATAIAHVRGRIPLTLNRGHNHAIVLVPIRPDGANRPTPDERSRR